MAKTFSCPKCGAPLDYDGGNDLTIDCPYCHNSVIVPTELRTGMPGKLHGQQLEKITRLLRAGKKIEAIKVYRETFNVGLKEAKDAVEAIERGESVKQPQIVIQVGAQNQPRSWLSKNWLWVVILIFFFCPGITFIPFLPCAIPAALISSIVGTATPSTPIERDVPATATPRAAPTVRVSPTPGWMSLALSFGSSGTAPGMFTDARNIAVDGAGNVYVGDYTGGRIQAFDANGKFTTQWNIDARAPLRGLAADRKGTVYVVQNGTILKFDSSGKTLGQLQYAEGNRFDGVTVLPDGGLLSIWYSQRNGIFTTTVGFRDDLVRFDAEGKTTQVIPTFLSSQTGDVELDTQIAVDGLGNIFALGGTFNQAVFKFSREGKFQNKFGSRGDLPGQFRSVSAIAIDNQSRVYIGDSRQVLVFAPDGRYMTAFDVEDSVSGMAFNDKNELWIVARTRVLKYVLSQR